MRVYFADLGAYNAGVLRGEWVEISPGMDSDDINRAIQKMLANSPASNVTRWRCTDSGCDHIETTQPATDQETGETRCEECGAPSRAIRSAEEWAIHDYESKWGLTLGEYESLETLESMAEAESALEGMGDSEFAHACVSTVTGRGEKVTAETIEEAAGHYIARGDNLEECGYEFAEACGLFEGWPETAVRYFDAESYASDIEINGSSVRVNSTLFLFDAY